MAKKIIKAQMKQRCDTFANWAAANPVLLDGELGIVSDDPNLYKVGDGSTAWNALPFRGFDGTLAQELGTSPNAVISQKVVSEKISELSEKIENLPKGEEFDKQGNYPLLHVGTADDLAGRGESVPAEFTFRASGGKSIKDGRAYIKRIKGNSVVWNNMVDTRGYEGDFIIRDGVTIIAGHKYLLMREKADGYLHLIPVVDGTENYDMILLVGEYGKIYTSQYTDTTDARVYGTTNKGGCIVSDLTQMFGAGNEPTTIEEFYSLVPSGIDLYAYNEGQVIHCNTESIKSVGDNAWDEQWEIGGIYPYDGESFDADNIIRSKDYNRIIGGQEYSFLSAQAGILILYDEHYNYVDYWDIADGQLRVLTIAENAAYFKICLFDYTYKNGTMLRLNHSGWKSDTGVGYEPYWQDTLPLPIIRKYFPDGMKSAGSAHDEIRYNKASGKWEYSKGKIKSVDLGTLDWWHNNEGRMVAVLAYGVFNKVSDYEPANVICAQYPIETYIHVYTNNYGLALSYQEPYLYVTVFDSSYTDAASFKAAMAGVILYYEAADWEWVELDAEDQNFRDYYNVADFGTEQAVSSKDSAPFKADIIYQFNAVDMIREHELEITELQKVIATMQAQLASLTNS